MTVYLTIALSIVALGKYARGQGILDGHTATANYSVSPTSVDSSLRKLEHYRGKHAHKALLEWQSLTNHAYLVETSADGTNWQTFKAVISGSSGKSFLIVDSDKKTKWRVELAATYPVPGGDIEVWLYIEPYIGGDNLFSASAYWQWSDGYTADIGGSAGRMWKGLYPNPEPLVFTVTVYASDGSSCSTFGAINIE